jgi:nucleotide-binding universal stress UspA family protein
MSTILNSSAEIELTQGSETKKLTFRHFQIYNQRKNWRKEGRGPMVKKIFVPTDGSPHARRAIELATDMAVQYGAALYVLHVVSESTIPDEVLRYIRVERVEEPPETVYLKKVGEGIIAAAEREAKDKGVKEIQSEVVQGDPAEETINFARDKGIDLIMIGSRGLGQIKGVFLGSVSSKVCHMAGCTCMTVK